MPGTEAELAQRNPDPATNGTVLSGDLAADDDPGNPFGATNDENACHVVLGSGTGPSAVLDGFTITGGNADLEPIYPAGNSRGGMLNVAGSPTVSNCAFTLNFASCCGGGMTNDSGSSPTVTDCSFDSNSASGCSGGGMSNDNNSSVTVSNSSFSNNSTSSSGGGMSNEAGVTVVASNCAFSGNSARSRGGAMYNGDNTATVSNCSFSGNSAQLEDGGAMYKISSSVSVSHCSFSNNFAGRFGDVVHDDACGPDISNSILWNGGAGSPVIENTNNGSTRPVRASRPP